MTWKQGYRVEGSVFPNCDLDAVAIATASRLWKLRNSAGNSAGRTPEFGYDGYVFGNRNAAGADQVDRPGNRTGCLEFKNNAESAKGRVKLSSRNVSIHWPAAKIIRDRLMLRQEVLKDLRSARLGVQPRIASTWRCANYGGYRLYVALVKMQRYVLWLHGCSLLDLSLLTEKRGNHSHSDDPGSGEDDQHADRLGARLARKETDPMFLHAEVYTKADDGAQRQLEYLTKICSHFCPLLVHKLTGRHSGRRFNGRFPLQLVAVVVDEVDQLILGEMGPDN